MNQGRSQDFSEVRIIFQIALDAPHHPPPPPLKKNKTKKNSLIKDLIMLLAKEFFLHMK